MNVHLGFYFGVYWVFIKMYLYVYFLLLDIYLIKSLIIIHSAEHKNIMPTKNVCNVCVIIYKIYTRLSITISDTQPQLALG